VKPLPIVGLCCTLLLPVPAGAYTAYNDNPFVEAMLRMMEIFGLIDRDRLSLGVPYLPGYSGFPSPGLGAYPALGAMPGTMPGSMPGSMPGLSPLPGLGGMPSPGGGPWASGWPGASGLPGAPTGYWPQGGTQPQRYGTGSRGPLDGIWELNKGGFIIMRGNAARLYLSRDRHQDFAIRYDRDRLWWRPTGGGNASQYRYQVRDGRMVMRDEDGNILLLRRRR